MSIVRVCLSQALVPTKKLQVLNILLLRLWSWRETLDHVYCRYVLDSWPSCAARSFWLKYFVSPLTCATPRVCVLNDATRCKISLVAARRSGQACRRSFKRPKVCTDAAIRASSVTFFQRWWVPLWGTMMKMNANEVMDWKAMCSKSSSKGSIRPTIHANRYYASAGGVTPKIQVKVPNKPRSSLAACLQHEVLDSDLGMDVRQSLHQTPKRRG